MTLHPLTSRKSWHGAAMAGTAVGLLVGVASVSAGMMLPPEVWNSYMDTSVKADAVFFADLLDSLVHNALARHAFLDRVTGVLELPGALIEALQRYDLALPVGARLGCALAAGGLAGHFVFNTMLSRQLARPAVQHVEGAKLLAGRSARRMLKLAWFEKYDSVADGVELVKDLMLPRRLEAEHILLLGGTGAGKTTILKHMIASAANKGDRMLLLDVKGDVTAFLPVKSFALLSLEDDRSARWVPGLDFTTHNDADELAIELIAPTADPSWSAGARQVLAAAIRLLQAEGRRDRRPWTWGNLYNLVRRPIEELHALLAHFDPTAAGFIDITREATQKAAMSFYLVILSNILQPLRALAKMGRSGRPLSIRRWMVGKDSRRALIVRQSQRLPEISASMARLILKVTADAAADRIVAVNPTPVWFFLDELPQIGKAAAVPRLAAIGRSAGARLVVAIQSLSQLRDNYGDNAAAHLLDNLTTKIIGRVPEGRTCEEVTGWIGNRTISYWNTTGRTSEGPPRAEKITVDVPVISQAFLTTELGLKQGVSGRPVVRALMLGQRDVALLDWPVGAYRNRRPAQVWNRAPHRPANRKKAASPTP
jgi:Type IV secretion-system coupling protein DNA-binding domain